LADVFFELEDVVDTGCVVAECRFDGVELVFLAVAGFVLAAEESWPVADTTNAQLKASAQTAPSCTFRIVLSPRTILQLFERKTKSPAGRTDTVIMLESQAWCQFRLGQ
jgi:hypothetical protein